MKSTKSAASTNSAGTESTWPHTALSAMSTGLKSTAAITRALTGRRSRIGAGASLAANARAIHATPRSATIAGSLSRR